MSDRFKITLKYNDEDNKGYGDKYTYRYRDVNIEDYKKWLRISYFDENAMRVVDYNNWRK